MRVLVAMSGGVDSSVAAAMVRDQGHEAVGVTLKLWGGESDSGCCSVADVDDARWAAQRLGIDHLVFGFADDFEANVVGPYVEAHKAGRTPNPCIECNRHLKFDRLLRRADQLGFDALATGHHCRVVADATTGERSLARGHDRAKDQSYVVHMAAGIDTGRVLFPVGELTKPEVRARAAGLGLRKATKPDSQDVCFITSTAGRAGFLGRRMAFTPGTVVDTEGAPVGRVDAIELVTVGQRRGLGGAGGGPARYVVDVDLTTATVVVGPPEQLLVNGVHLDQIVLRRPHLGAGEVLVQCSAHGPSRPAWFDGRDRLEWVEPQRSVAAGQSIVLYDATDTVVLAGGIATR